MGGKMEITADLNLTPQEESLLDMHSFLNVMNVFNACLYLLADDIDDEDILRPGLRHCQSIADSLANTDTALASARALDKTVGIINDNLAEVRAQYPNFRSNIEDAQANIDSVFHILEIRARYEQDELWVDFRLSDLNDNMVNVLSAIELNAKGRYRIVYNVASKTDNDYLVHLDFSSPDNKGIRMPAVFQDVMRDLIANARKYTPAGGEINAGLAEDGETLRFVVTDSGMGIPDDQINQVVLYGQRARNVLGRRTMGGGFGLTKAYFVTRQLGGRMWIDSDLNVGTTITIELPVK